MKNAYVMMGNRTIDLLRCLSLSKSIRDSGSDQSIVFLSFDNLDFKEYLSILKRLDITLKFCYNPIDISKILNQYYAKYISDISWDFFKLLPWSLTDFDNIIFMDTDMLVLKNIDHLFHNNYDFMYTDGRISPLNSGLFVAKPNLTTFYGLQHFIYSGDFATNSGWFNMGRKHKHYAIEVCQGVFYYYFIQSKKFSVEYLPRRLYNNLSPQCLENTNEEDIKVVHFTSWGKPPLSESDIIHPFQRKIHNQWNKNLCDLGVYV